MNKRTFILSIIAFLFLINNAFAGVFFSDGFESGDVSHKENGFFWKGLYNNGKDYTVVSSEKAHSGRYSLKFHFKAGPAGDDANAQQDFNLGSNKSDLYIRFFIFLPINYAHRSDGPNNKFLRLWGDDYNDPVKMGATTWYNSSPDIISALTLESRLVNNITSCSGGINNIWVDGKQIKRYPIQKTILNKWTEMQIHLKTDSGKGDGAAELWVNGVKVISEYNIKQLGAPCNPGYFRNGFLLGWSNSGYSEDTEIYIDDVVFSDSYIDNNMLLMINTNNTAGNTSSTSSSSTQLAPPAPKNIIVIE